MSLQQLRHRSMVTELKPDYYVRPLRTSIASEPKVEGVGYPLAARFTDIHHPSPCYKGGVAPGVLDPVPLHPAHVAG